jgi:hypothetical protein
MNLDWKQTNVVGRYRAAFGPLELEYIVPGTTIPLTDRPPAPWKGPLPPMDDPTATEYVDREGDSNLGPNSTGRERLLICRIVLATRPNKPLVGTVQVDSSRKTGEARVDQFTAKFGATTIVWGPEVRARRAIQLAVDAYVRNIQRAPRPSNETRE